MDQMMQTKGANVVIVGMKLHSYNVEGDDDANGDERTSGRELLTSTLSGLTETGDSVIALHVQSHHSTSDVKSRRWRRSESGKIEVDSFRNDDIYESICNIKKKVDIQVKVVENGSSLKKIVVEEAKKAKATKVILSYANGKAHSSPLQHMSPVSLAKYCSKRLPYSCSVIVIEEGKVAFQKEGAMKKQYDDDDASRVLNSIRRTIQNHTKIARNTIIPHHIMKRKSCSPPQQLLQLDDHRKHSRVSVPLMQFLDKSALAHIICTSQGRVIGSKKMAEKAHRRVHCLPESIKSDDSTDGRFKLYHGSSLDRFSQANLHVIADPLQAGWPLLRRCTTMNENRQMSVVEWALHLPDRPKENPNGQYFPWRLVECTTITKGNTMEVVKDIDKNIMHPICNANTIPPRLELLIREKKSCHREFHLLELQAATCNFSTSNMIGKGGCSKVYRGTLLNGESVAVKCINASSPDSEDEFVTEVEIIGSLRHRHIVQLFGYCIGFDHYYLVYNFASQGNLEHKLHGYGDLKTILPWEVRYKVAVGIAEALTYLHDTCTRPVIHRDVKSSNILLDSSLAPMLADFGLAKWAPTSSSHITCGDVVGTFGYLAPEYFMFGKVSEKTDVFSFGVVLLELVTGRKPINNGCAKGEENLVVWARPLLDDGLNFGLLVDPKLEGNYNEAQLKSMIIAGALCLRQSPQRRPRMIRILEILLKGEVGDLEYATSARHDISCKELVDDIEYDMRSIYSSEYSDNIQEHLTLAFLGLDDDESSLDESSIDDNVILSHSSIKDMEEYSR